MGAGNAYLALANHYSALIEDSVEQEETNELSQEGQDPESMTLQVDNPKELSNEDERIETTDENQVSQEAADAEEMLHKALSAVKMFKEALNLASKKQGETRYIQRMVSLPRLINVSWEKR